MNAARSNGKMCDSGAKAKTVKRNRKVYSDFVKGPVYNRLNQTKKGFLTL